MHLNNLKLEIVNRKVTYMVCENYHFYINFSYDIKCQSLDENSFDCDLIVKFKENKNVNTI